MKGFLPALAIELSQREGSICVRGEDGREEVRRFAAGNRERDELLPAIDSAVAAIGCRGRDLKLLACDIGPGGFTGLRVSIATVQGIAEVSGASVVGVDGGVVAAQSTPAASDADGTVLVLLASKRDSVWAGHLELDDGIWRHVSPAGVISLPPSDAPALVLADSHLPESFRDAFDEAGVRVECPLHDAVALLDLALGRAAKGDTTSPEELLPLYPREPEAVRLWRDR